MRKALRWMLWIALILNFAWVCCFVPICNETTLDSDMASDMVLARVLSQEGGILSTNWYYSTELHVLHTQLVSVPLFWITDNWQTVRTVGGAILYLILLLSAYYCCCQLKIRKGFPVVGILLMSPLSIQYLSIVLRSACYVPYIAISFCLMGMLVQQAGVDARWKRGALVGGAALLSFASGLGGMRQPIVFHAPFLLMALYLYAYTQYNAERSGTALVALSRRMLVPAIISTVMAGAGTLVNEMVLSRYFSFFHYKPMFVPFDFEEMFSVLYDAIAFFGYQTGQFNIQTLLGFLLTVALWGVALSVLVRHWAGKTHGDNPEQTVLVVFAAAAMLVLMAIYAFTSMSYRSRYLLPALVFMYPVLGVAVEHMNWKPLFTKCAAALLAGALVLFSGLTWRICALDGVAYLDLYTPADELKVIAAEMVEQGYRRGYSSFWYGGNTMTELSNGALDMYVWYDGSQTMPSTDEAGIDTIDRWLQLTAHDTPPDANEPFFIMLYMPHAAGTDYIQMLDDSDIIFTTDNYRVYGYENRAAYDSSLRLAE